MEYDDAARRYNFLAGLGIGAVLGAGLAMLTLPQKKVLMRQARKGRRRLGKTPAKQGPFGVFGNRPQKREVARSFGRGGSGR